jgi:hypothetical protein
MNITSVGKKIAERAKIQAETAISVSKHFHIEIEEEPIRNVVPKI